MNSTTDVTTPTRSRWYLELQFYALLLFVLCCYAPRLTEISVRGEESRRGRIAWEMLDTGDWIVPRIQGGVVYYRPPLQNWLIALVGRATGQIDAFALRFPTLIALFMTVSLIYAYARTFMSRLGAFAAGTVFATFAQVLELGRLGETEGVFTLFVAGSLLCWKGLLNRRSPAPVVWIVGYSLAALATLTKGPQAPLYFVGPTVLYLLLTRRWRFLFSFSHLMGIAAFVAIVAAWQIPFAGQVGASQSWKIYFRDVGPRFSQMEFSQIAANMASYPLELLCGALLPWSFFLIAFCSRRFRAQLGILRDDSLFCLFALAATFPSVWLPPGASLRYYMPMYPVIAILIGIVFERLALVCNEWDRSKHLLAGYWRLLAIFMSGTVVAIAGISIVNPQARWSQPLWLAMLLLIPGFLGAGFLWKKSLQFSSRSLQQNLIVASWFLALFCCTVVPNIRTKISRNAEHDIAQLRASLPPGTHFQSLGITHHLFLFHLREHVTVLHPPEMIQEAPPADAYFCLTVHRGKIPQLPFQWERIATINCDRNYSEKPIDEVFICRAAPHALTATDE